MNFDVDAFEERAAIIQFDVGLSRFEAETLAAKAQGISRREAMNARGRIASQTRHNGEVARKSRQNNLPGMQSYSEEKAG